MCKREKEREEGGGDERGWGGGKGAEEEWRSREGGGPKGEEKPEPYRYRTLRRGGKRGEARKGMRGDGGYEGDPDEE